MNIDPNGNAWWEWVLGALAVVGITAAVATGAAFVAGAVAGTATASAVATGAVIGGLSLGGAELVSQGVSSNWGELDWGSLAIETVSGSVYGGLTGMMSSTTSVGLRLGLRGGLVATSGLNTALHGINQGKSFRDIMFDVGISMGLGLVSQGAMLGLDMRAGKLSASILELYAVDGGLFILKDRLMIATTSFFKNFNRNFNLREFIFS